MRADLVATDAALLALATLAEELRALVEVAPVPCRCTAVPPLLASQLASATLADELHYRTSGELHSLRQAHDGAAGARVLRVSEQGALSVVERDSLADLMRASPELFRPSEVIRTIARARYPPASAAGTPVCLLSRAELTRVSGVLLLPPVRIAQELAACCCSRRRTSRRS